MRRTLPLLWGPLLAVLLAGPLLQRSPGWGEAIGSRPDVPGSPAEAVLPSAWRQRALPFRPFLDRQGLPLAPALPARNWSHIGAPTAIDSSADRVSVAHADSARHFPLFPTGPPSHG